MEGYQQKIVSLLIGLTVFLTGNVLAEAKTNYREAENWAMKPTNLTKPVDEQQLIDVINQHLNAG